MGLLNYHCTINSVFVSGCFINNNNIFDHILYLTVIYDIFMNSNLKREIKLTELNSYSHLFKRYTNRFEH